VATARVIPSVDALLQREGVKGLEARYGATAVRQAVRAAAEAIRDEVRGGGAGPATADEAAARIELDAASRLAGAFQGSLRRVINATGVVLHTNLGRAPLSEAAVERIGAIARGYSNLEYDVDAGARGSRAVHAEPLLRALTGAEAAVVVNNNAAAVLLMLTALCRGREAIISRGELVEIGGGFRVPDVMAQSGAMLREVGTTNRTRVADYTAAAGPRTALILRVHPSNFRVAGFTERPALPALVAAAREAGVPIAEDLGSGQLVDGLPDEPSVSSSIAAGVDLVCFSGDKLLGGPQAGIVVGRRALVDPLRRHPLMRALRVDKLTYAALEATLLEYLAGRARQTVPAARMLHVGLETIEARARTLAEALSAGGWQVQLVSGHSAVGGGSAPGLELPTMLVAVERDGMSAAAIEQALRAMDTPVVARISDGRVVLDPRTLSDEEADEVARMMRA
jgi:L-seryl-tRNA(Ser) seleniumtransferase